MTCDGLTVLSDRRTSRTAAPLQRLQAPASAGFLLSRLTKREISGAGRLEDVNKQ